MTVFRVYQQFLTDEQRNELNGPNGGWDSKPEFTAYADLGFGTRIHDLSSADGMVREAAEFGLYRHVADIIADDLHELFFIGNMGPEDDRIRRTNIVPMTSVSVGNVVIDTTTDKAWFCDYVGWVELFDKTKTTIEATTITTILLST